MGEPTLRELLKQRKANYTYLHEKLTDLLAKHGERILVTKNNKISIAATLTNLNEKVFLPNNINATFFGSYLFHRRVSGVRVCASSDGKKSTFGNGDHNKTSFANYGTHCDVYPCLPYFTSASAIGQKQTEIDTYIIRLDEAFKHFYSADPFGIFKKNAQLNALVEEE